MSIETLGKVGEETREHKAYVDDKLIRMMQVRQSWCQFCILVLSFILLDLMMLSCYLLIKFCWRKHLGRTPNERDIWAIVVIICLDVRI